VSIGGALAEARDQAGLTVAQVSQRTRIRQTIIRGIESDDYSTCGGDFYARGHIRSIAKVVGADPEPLIREYDTARRAPGALSAVSVPELVTRAQVTRARAPGRRRRNWAIAGVAALAIAVGVVAYTLLSGSSHAASAPPAARHHAPAHRHAGDGSAHPAAQASQHPASQPRPRHRVPVRTLTPVSATAFGVGGAGQGDNPQGASLTTDGNPGTAWHTDWYTTASFGNLYAGTGLLLDMGRPVTIITARITLGSIPGASIQLRVGYAPPRASLPPVAQALNASGVLRLRPAAPAHGRYVLIWFTRLPPDPAGTFQADVYGVSLRGHG